jgi:uracil phosphoribosyltransferase
MNVAGWLENSFLCSKNPTEIMKIINFAESNSILNQYVAEIRNVEIQNDRLRFRRNIERIGEIMAYEISKSLSYSPKDVQTPLGTATINTPDNALVLSTILRAGLPFHQGFLHYFDYAENAFVSAYRKYKDTLKFDIHIEYIASPRIDEKTLIITDPMLATGGSMELSYQAMLTKGHPAEIHIASIIASRQAVDHIAETFPSDKTTVWCAAIDPEINAHSYIIPGLGDAGDLAYGEKE